MIVTSLLLIVAAVGLLVLGLLGGTDGYLVGSIAASLLASIALIVGGRRHAAKRLGGRVEAAREDLADEPLVQATSPGDAARVASMTSRVFVVVGRPRYHSEGCSHLRDRVNRCLPARQAVEQGFTPCSLCEPDTALLAQQSDRSDNRV